MLGKFKGGLEDILFGGHQLIILVGHVQHMGRTFYQLK